MHDEGSCRCVLVVGTRSRWLSNVRQDYSIYRMNKMNPANSENPLNSVTIGVVGAGTMGNGIAQVSARAGYNVIMHDVREEFLDRGLKGVYKGRVEAGERE